MQELISNILPGLAGMPNLHPMVVHFPIALLSSFLLLEFLSIFLKSESLKTGATWMLYLGTLGTVVAVLAGFRAAGAVGHDEAVHAIMETHEHLGLTVLLISIVLSLWRILTAGRLKGTLRLIYLALAVIMVITMSFGADYGGLMVYTHGVGIKGMESSEGAAHGQSAEEVNKTPQEIEKAEHDSTPHKH
ncbi:MAG: DUF2231 domain-containing protein [Proteobacteria bacterium]|nr:DUF2231 domain-containing protein [Pseudomonadota bacterium]